MQLKAATLFFGLLFLGCAAPGVYKQDPIFASAIAEYRMLFDAPVNYDVVFVDSLPGETVGICHRGIITYVHISREAYAEFNDCQREQLLFHEMSHCSFGVKHRDVSKSDEMPDSIMSTYIISGNYYCAHRDQYIEQLRSMIYR